MTIDSPTAKADDTAAASSGGIDSQNTPASLARSAWSRMQSLFSQWPASWSPVLWLCWSRRRTCSLRRWVVTCRRRWLMLSWPSHIGQSC